MSLGKKEGEKLIEKNAGYSGNIGKLVPTIN